MKRFNGMMPADAIEREEHYKDENGLDVTIQAGPEGWTVLYADGSSEYNDVKTTTDENFKTAYDCAVENLGELNILISGKRYDV